MPERMDKNHPVLQKEIDSLIDEVLRSHGIDLEDPLKAELLSRAHLDYGYREWPLVRFRTPDNALLSAGDCLDVLLSASEQTTDTPSGPTRIHYTDKEAVFGVDIEKIARGQLVVFDDRRHPR